MSIAIFIACWGFAFFRGGRIDIALPDTGVVLRNTGEPSNLVQVG